MNSLFIRTAAILTHAALNFLLITWLISYDISSRWVWFIGFIVLALFLLYLFVRHLMAYIYFLKTKTK